MEKAEEKRTMAMSKKNKIFKFVGCMVTAEVEQGRTLKGTLTAFDRHMNLILSDTEEFRTIRAKRGRKKETQERKHLGFVLLRGQHVLTLTMDGASSMFPMNADRFAMDDQAKANIAAQVTKQAEPTTAATNKLAAPARGVGAPSRDVMMPGQKP
eukprot:TRINITY_DN3288_c1_g4_i1.p1 TRINITY_DN3288_c1_g4~~TRINITY_DN3288_c1_g4_i1.p1  ORF type:complete len:155 (+),score=51.71 TRINITY_DN3288_c1_g4_i1:68-532(+)